MTHRVSDRGFRRAGRFGPMPSLGLPGTQRQQQRPPVGNGAGRQGLAACPVCQAEVTLRLAGTEFADRHAGIRLATPVLSTHAMGGGRASRRNGIPCPGSGRLPA